jgi:4'-phosphopantetheinyl transferase
MHTAAVWLLDCRRFSDQALEPFAAWLGPSEQQRLARFGRRLRRRQFLAGRVLLRRALAPVLGIPAASVSLVERRDNAPLLDLPDSTEVGFSVSHSGHWVACAVSATTKLGLDVELPDGRRDIGALAAQAFDPGQQAWLASLPPQEGTRAFYRMWSAAEARFKLQAEVAQEIELQHAELSIVLCSASRLVRPPLLQAAELGSPG